MTERLIGASFKLTIHDLSRGGSGVGRLDKQVVFVPFTSPGDVVQVEITVQEKRYLEGKITQILEPSPLRISPRCPVFGRCGGCAWQHIPYDLQWKTKSKGALQALTRAIGQIPQVPVLDFPADDPWNYRNRVQLRSHGKEIGFFERNSQSLVSIERCDLAKPQINAVLSGVLDSPELKNASGLQKVEIDQNEEGEVRVAINQRHAAFGFRQVNDAQNRKLQQWVKDSFLEKSHFLDLFGGSGNLSRLLFQEMHAVECVDLTVPENESAPAPNFHFHKSDVLPWLRQQLGKEKRNPLNWKFPRVAVLDPPREGLGRNSGETLESLERLEVTRFVLVGCDPDSFARDVSQALKKNWKLESLAFFDFFPQTPHIESAGRFTR